MRKLVAALLGIVLLVLPTAAFAQDGEVVEEIAFAGGTLTITETPDYEKVVAFNGREIGRDYVAFFDRVVSVSGMDVALFTMSPGGNACGGYPLMVWSDNAGDVKSDAPDDTCGFPSPAVTDYTIYFVPSVGPGETAALMRWTPNVGFRTMGNLRFAPDPGTGWKELGANPAIHPVDYFAFEAFYDVAAATLGDELQEYTTGLGTAPQAMELNDGLFGVRGCQPHNCGGSDSILIVDIAGEAAWFAQMRGTGFVYWPPLGEWQGKARTAFDTLASQ